MLTEHGAFCFFMVSILVVAKCVNSQHFYGNVYDLPEFPEIVCFIGTLN